MSDPKLVWYSNSPWSPTGYGTQTASVTQRLKAAGYDVAITANHGLVGRTMEWNGIKVYPGGVDAYSNDIAVAHYHAFTAGEWAPMVALYDGWVLDPSQFRHVPVVASWLPVDHYPCPPSIAGWASLPNVRPVAMSEFGQRAFAEAGIEATFIPHGIETDTFRPTASQFRELNGIPEDAFVVGIVAANQGNNPPRKGWSEMLQAVAHFMRQHGDVYLYLHTHPTGVRGIDLKPLITALGIPTERVKWVGLYSYVAGNISPAAMAAAYSGMDVLLATSYGEGYGLPVVEAQACGTPVIVSDWTAQPELVGSGWVVPVQPYWDAPHSSFFGIPFIHEIAKALALAYDMKGNEEFRAAAVDFAQKFDHDRIFDEKWVPFLDSLKPVEPNREERRRRRRK